MCPFHLVQYQTSRERAGKKIVEGSEERTLVFAPVPLGTSVSAALCRRSQLQVSIAMMPVMGRLMFNMKAMTPFPFRFPPRKAPRLSLARRRSPISRSVIHKAFFFRGCHPWPIPL